MCSVLHFFMIVIKWLQLKLRGRIRFYMVRIIIFIFVILGTIYFYTIHKINSNIKICNSAADFKTSSTIKNLLNQYGCFKSSENVDDELINLRICPNFGEGIKIMFVVTSSPEHEENRNNIRRTWGSLSLRKDLAIGFIIGSTRNKRIAEKIEVEQLLHGDLIKVTLLDTYENLTIKTTLMLHWVTKYCSKAAYVIKVDDDVFVNVDLLLEFIDQHKIIQNRSIYGRLARNWLPVRDPKNKYYLPKDQFSADTFPDFLTGPAYIFPISLAIEMYNNALGLPFLKMEDVFYNGIVASRLNISRINIPEFVNNRVNLEDCLLEKPITLHDLHGEDLYYIWYRVNVMNKNKCNNRLHIFVHYFKNFLHTCFF